ncbi:hypothetical protein DFR58_105199 [Anaerobacterium chartisolvens]|uniref:Uncharacterized protein n=1 Tax=Anaerobacterium chartisolvens TaxID=1297424 RepID=A0A369BAT2_9FIRM|nr:hypothetical protein DFR58_105199 [Anaerobacterium chartisolvens]
MNKVGKGIIFALIYLAAATAVAIVAANVMR